MKSIILSPAAAHSSGKAYAVKRMNIAAERLLRAETTAEEIRAGHWVLAWAVAAGARPSARALRSAEDCVSSLAGPRLH